MEVATNVIEEYIELDRAIDAAEDDAIRSRWEFGRKMLEERDANGGKKLPDGRMAELVERTGKSATELKYRALFAARFPTVEALVNAVDQHGSWHNIVNDALPTLGDKPKEKAEKQPTEPPTGEEVARRLFAAITELDDEEAVKAWREFRELIADHLQLSGWSSEQIEEALGG